MLFWLFLILIAVGVLIANIPNLAEKFLEKSYNSILDFIYHVADGFFSIAGVAIVIASSISAMVMLIIISANQIGDRALFESTQEKYNALIYKVENDSYRDEFGLLNKEVIDEIQKWNEDLTFLKSNQRDFWIGIFIPNIYDDFEKIDYEKF